MKRIAPVLALLLVVASAARARPGTHHARVIEAVKPSMVVVEYTLQFDKGDRPPDYWRYVEQERPLETAGFALSPTLVVARDILVHSRFIRKIMVVRGDEAVSARPARFALHQEAVLLQLDQPLRDVKPLAFKARRRPPYFAVTSDKVDTVWTLSVEPLPKEVSIDLTGRHSVSVPFYCLIVDSRGRPVGMAIGGDLPPGDSWKGSPADWPAVSAEEMARLLKDVEHKAKLALLRVDLRFRSPKRQAGGLFARRSYDEEENGTERNVLGVLLGDKDILILTGLSRKLTARLERIRVHPPDGAPVPARFSASLRDYACLLARLDRPLPGALPLGNEAALSLRHRLLLAAQITVKGEERVGYFQHVRVHSFKTGWRRQVYPRLPEEIGYLFDLKGQLLAVPVGRRRLPSMSDRWSSDGDPIPTSTLYLQEALGNPAAHADPHLVPLSEAEESRLAWMGVELQPLSRELARANGVAHLTSDGDSGALVSYVYSQSPAAKAGIEAGMVLLRLHVQRQPEPIEIVLSESRYPREPFPWDRLDQLPEAFYERVPVPWPPVDNSFTEMLTDVGLGTKYTAELFSGGQLIRRDFVVEQSPPHYDAAPRYKSKPLGLSVRDLTYEARRYFHKKPGDPGVIISRIKPGSKASVAGLKPYEIITHVNGASIKSVADFKKQVEGQEALRLSVKRLARSRLVEIKIEDAERNGEP